MKIIDKTKHSKTKLIQWKIVVGNYLNLIITCHGPELIHQTDVISTAQASALAGALEKSRRPAKASGWGRKQAVEEFGAPLYSSISCLPCHVA